jgi:formate--tetrahydrofolate ligase
MVIILDAMKPIVNILKKYHISKNDTVSYGSYLAKIKPILSKPKKNHKLILVTATSPTPAGEGKTTVSIGLNDALNHLGKQSIVTLREPSMGPVFGVKGGANGGGKAQVIPKDDIDLHLTGDFHAITAANNLIAACIDNHIY